MSVSEGEIETIEFLRISSSNIGIKFEQRRKLKRGSKNWDNYHRFNFLLTFQQLKFKLFVFMPCSFHTKNVKK